MRSSVRLHKNGELISLRKKKTPSIIYLEVM